jgi:hypothetical protein
VSESPSTATINQGKAEPNPTITSAGTGRFPPSVGDAVAGDTARYYAAPQYAPAPVHLAQAPKPAPPPSSGFNALARFMKGLFFFLLVAGLVGATAGAVFFSQEASRERRRRNELEQRAEARADANGRAKNAWEQMEDAVKLILEAEEKAAGAGATLSTGAEKPVDLGKYAYPGAQSEAKIGNYGSETLSMLTPNNFATVREFYERQFGKPVIQVLDDRHWGQARKKILFQSFPILVRVEEIEKSQVKITILHSLLRFPKIDEAQAQNSR